MKIGTHVGGANTGRPRMPASAAAPRVSVLRIVLILLAVMVALPAFVMGAELSQALGAVGAIRSSLPGARSSR